MIIFHPQTVHSIYKADDSKLRYAVFKFDINKIVNALRQIKSEKENELFDCNIDVREYKEVYCNIDWYILTWFFGRRV